MSNFKNNRWLSIATLILLVANIVTLTLMWTSKKNETAGKGHPPVPGPVFEFLTKELQLNESQQAAYRLLRDKHQAEQKRFQDSIRKAKDALFSLLKQPNVPDSLVNEYSKRATSFDQQLDIITFRHFREVRALCNAEQQQKFDAIIRDVLHRMAPPGRGQRPPPAAQRGGPADFPPPDPDREPPTAQ
ncbi:MAG: hypothetical protein ABI741_03160 [Ferruginibacter sp.]